MSDSDAIRSDESSAPEAGLEVVRIEAGRDDAGRRVDQLLFERLGGLSRMRIRNLIAAGCRLNGAPGRAGLKVAAGDIVELEVPPGPPSSMDPDPIPLEIAYEDDEILVVVKPHGMLAHPTLGVKRGTLMNALAYHLNIAKSKYAAGEEAKLEAHGSSAGAPGATPLSVRPGLVHRLDRETSGLMVIAKTQRALVILSKHFRRRLVEKRYLALVRGVLNQGEGMIDAPIGRDPDQRPRWRVLQTGKPAQTRFKVLELGDGVTLVELEPVTGRTNQLRIHCAFAGHPIVGDTMYDEVSMKAAPDAAAPDTEASSPDTDLTAQIPRLRLHAFRLAFHHPATGEWMTFTSWRELGFQI